MTGFENHLSLQPGWQKMENVNAIVPKGTIMVVDYSSHLVVDGESDMGEENAPVTEGVVVFFESKRCFSQGSLWIYLPGDYSYITKLTNFSSEYNGKLSDLVGAQSEVKNFYFVGHP